MTYLTGKTALVTGASRGIGRAVARRLATAGALVAVHYGSNHDAAAETVQLIEKDGGRAFPVRAELGVPGDVDTLFAALEAGLAARTGQARLDILVNNAAINTGGTVQDITPEAFDRLVAINTKAPLFITQRALPLLNEGGRIINVTTAATRIAMPEAPYAMTKAPVEVLSRSLAQTVGAQGITVNAVAPGPTVTDMNPWMLGNPEVQQMVGTGNAIPRVGQPDDIADVVAFLASHAGRWVTGQVIDASGGCFLGPRI
ncbi:SDR family oxidoreductase [Actinomadura rupiterrae]|uniref:SDR family oxidoreductase n=1 Tax=Actinomadura rupiterrae TaxID=559627 RepID=UPI0020A30EE9|nr:SDR family oxidoreductase [Actinomadura rupiterrae]MCP2335212.1 NAD(P)-dependent dehydrogenase (short-subunit alcohol dehydrogenase family) [Actinomadura rupiterrae]